MFNRLRYFHNGNRQQISQPAQQTVLPVSVTYPVFLPGDISGSLLTDQDPGYDIPLPHELCRWENEGGTV